MDRINRLTPIRPRLRKKRTAEEVLNLVAEYPPLEIEMRWEIKIPKKPATMGLPRRIPLGEMKRTLQFESKEQVWSFFHRHYKGLLELMDDLKIGKL